MVSLNTPPGGKESARSTQQGRQSGEDMKLGPFEGECFGLELGHEGKETNKQRKMGSEGEASSSSSSSREVEEVRLTVGERERERERAGDDSQQWR